MNPGHPRPLRSRKRRIHTVSATGGHRPGLVLTGRQLAGAIATTLATVARPSASLPATFLPVAIAKRSSVAGLELARKRHALEAPHA